MTTGKGKEQFDPDRAPGFKEDFKVRRDLALELRRLREAAGLSQEVAAKMATFTSGTWSNIEIMRYQVSRLEYLMAAFRVVGKRLRIVVEDIEEETSGSDNHETLEGEFLRPTDPMDEEESLRSLAQRAFAEAQERLSGVHPA